MNGFYAVYNVLYKDFEVHNVFISQSQNSF